MKRREFITLLGGGAAWPIPLRAQQAMKMPLIGILSPGRSELSDPTFNTLNAFLQGLHELGYTEGQNLAIEKNMQVGVQINSASWPLNWLVASPISLSCLVRRRRARPSKQPAQSPSSR